MERQFVKIEKGLGAHGRIAVVRFDRGDNINALSRRAMRELRDVPAEFEDDLSTSVVILTGSAKAFSAGFDLKQAFVSWKPSAAWKIDAGKFTTHVGAEVIEGGGPAFVEAKLAERQRLLSRKRRGSKNRKKAKKLVGKAYSHKVPSKSTAITLLSALTNVVTNFLR